MQLSAETLKQSLLWPQLVEALRDIFIKPVTAPVRHHHSIPVPNDPTATLLLMPAWIEGEFLGVKQVNVFPGNNARNLPGLTSHYTLSCGKTGQTLAQMDGNTLTSLRTAAASALASSFLSRQDSKTMLMMGAGRMARNLIPAHMSVRPIDEVWVWNHNIESSENLVNDLKQQGIKAHVVNDSELAKVAGNVDIISCATLSNQAILKGEWVNGGTHIDLVGSFTPAMRETDDLMMQKAAIFVDTRAGALSETGDLISPIKTGAISESDVLGELTELCGASHLGRQALADADQAITLFKSVGDSREDLAAAILAYQLNK